MKIKLRLLAIAAIFALLFVPATALAQPLVPLQYEGNVTIGGTPAPLGTIISAEIGGAPVASNAPAGIDEAGYYRLDVPAHQGDVIVLKVNGVVGGQATHPDPMSTWHVVCPLATYTLTVNVDPLGSGTVALNPPDGDSITPQAQYASVNVVTVTLDPAPASSYQFDHWSGNLTGSDDPATLLMDGNKTVIAHFTSIGPAPGPLTADAGGPYSGTAGSPVSLSGLASGGVSPYSYAWDLDNNGTYETSGKDVSHTWATAGDYTVGLKVTDNVATTATVTASVHITTVPPPAVGGEAFPPNKLAILAPSIALAIAIIAGATILIRRRRAYR